jgi:phosphomannomutase/phosphoglucomutase
MPTIPHHIFRAYDIRGVVTNELTAPVVEKIGHAFGSAALDAGEDTLIVARDGRLSGPELIQALKTGIAASGCNVIDLGMVPTPVLYFATHILKSQSGVMLTGSHNPPDYNGLKSVIKGHTLSGDAIQNLYQRIVDNDLHTGAGTITEQDIEGQYLERIVSDIKLERPLSVIVDAGNGVTGELAPKLLRALGCTVTEMYCDIDGHFPNHHPDPSKPENVSELIDAVKAQGADVGLGFDGDGDRLGVVTPAGELIWPDRQLILYAQDVLQDDPGATIVFDVKCSSLVAKEISKAGGKPLMYKTGHALIKNKMKEVNAALAGEMSGHMFFKHRWYGFDDALYGAARLLNIMAKTPDTLDEIFTKIPTSITTPEINVTVPDTEKFDLMDVLVADAHTLGGTLIDIDGMRVEFDDGWGLIRASNTTPCLVCRFEADTNEALARIQAAFNTHLLKHNAGLDVPF